MNPEGLLSQALLEVVDRFPGELGVAEDIVEGLPLMGERGAGMGVFEGEPFRGCGDTFDTDEKSWFVPLVEEEEDGAGEEEEEGEATDESTDKRLVPEDGRDADRKSFGEKPWLVDIFIRFWLIEGSNL